MNKHIKQIKSEELCMILDVFTGENIQFADFADYKKSIGTIKEALDFLEKYPHEWKWIIVKLSCIVSPNLAGIKK